MTKKIQTFIIIKNPDLNAHWTYIRALTEITSQTNSETHKDP